MSKKNYCNVHHFKIPKRTEGDGMEDSIKLENRINSEIKSVQLVDDKSNFGTIIRIIPQSQNKTNNTQFNITYRKEPKFVPYEPYKAAVNPLVPANKCSRKKEKQAQKNSNDVFKHLPSINNLSVQENYTFDDQLYCKPNDNQLKRTSLPWDEEKQILQIELSNLKEENYELENQLKFQAQVNGELKKLLVAAVGEDIEVRVQLLTQDKLHLASELLKTGKCLSTHQEQIEWLAGQCEVWKSKFLASSCLIEDLAKWKAGLSQKVTECKETLKHLMGEINEIKYNVYNTSCKLSILHEKFNLNGDDENDQYKKRNIIDLCSNNLKLVDCLMAQLLGNNDNVDNNSDGHNNEFLTDPEKSALQLINQPLISLEQTELACNAVMMGASIALTSSSPHCSHCNGIIKTI